MTQTTNEPIAFEGEEAGAGQAAPLLDLLASGFLLALSVVVLVASVRLPIPGDVRTAPGLLPFLTTASLGVMAVMLGVSALVRHRAGVVMHPEEARDAKTDRRAVLLGGAVFVYIAALQTLAFQLYFSVFGADFVLSAFEPVTTIALAAIIHASWRGPLWITALISVLWAFALSIVFQKLFQIPLPGGF